MERIELAELTGRRVPTESSPLELLDDVELDVSLEFGRAYLRRETIAHLEPDAIIALNEPIGHGIGVWVGDRLIARGEMIVVDGKWGVQVIEIIAGQPVVG